MLFDLTNTVFLTRITSCVFLSTAVIQITHANESATFVTHLTPQHSSDSTAPLQAESPIVSTSSDAEEDAFAFPDTSSTTKNNVVSDPFIGYNRVMFNMNSKLDTYIAKPTAKTYKAITPKPIRSGVGSFFNNLNEPWNATNLLLQGDATASFKSLGRFAINTVTTLGLADPASDSLNLITTQEDFGQTLGTWGVPSGPYLVLPVLGPSSLRDASGRVIDSTGNPFSYIDNSAVSATAGAIYGIDKRAQLLSFEGIVNTSDYELVRDVYLEKRMFDIKEHGAGVAQAQGVSFDEGFGD